MVDDEVIQLAALEHMGKAFKEHAADALIHRIKQHGFFIEHQVSIIAYAPRDGEDVLKQREPAVIPADPEKILADRNGIMHGKPPIPIRIA